MLSAVLTSCDLFGANTNDGSGGSDSGGDNSGDNGATEWGSTVYSPTSSMSTALTKSAVSPAYELAVYDSLLEHFDTLGVPLIEVNDSAARTGAEIAIGNTSREASVAAKALADAKFEQGGISYAIVYKNGVLAIYGSSEPSLRMAVEYAVTTYFTSTTLTVDADLSFVFSMTAEEYEQQIADKNEDVAWEDRFDVLSDYISEDSIKSLRRMYALFDENLYLWLANLWDSDNGAFYYSCSARDYEGFLPDVESTCQALKIICGSGMTDEWGGGLTSLDAAIPEDIQEQILDFVFSLYCDDDGYFYHPQWGRAINDDRKGRDLTWSLQIVEYFGSELPDGWVDAITRLENQNAATASLEGRSSVSAAVSKVADSYVSAVADDGRFESAAKFIKYLDSLDIRSNPYGRGHMVASQADQIKAAGLIDVCLEYFNNIQEEVYNEQIANGEHPSGMWSSDVSYSSVSGFFKISVVYNKSNKTVQKYLDYVVDSCIACILSDEAPGQTVYVYNPWAALGEAVSAMKRANSISSKSGEGDIYDVDATYAKIRALAGDLFSATYEKALAFRKADGGYSYYEANAAATIQGVYASLGLAEGDVNATCLLAYHMISYMNSAFGFKLPAIWNGDDFDRFLAEIDGVEPIEKKEGKNYAEYVFDDLDENGTLDPSEIKPDNGTYGLSVTEDPEDYSNRVLLLDSPMGEASGCRIYTNLTSMKSCFVFEADFYMQSKTSGTTHQISFYSGGTRSYMLTFAGGTDRVQLGCNSNVKSGIQENFGVSVSTEDWFTLRVEIYPESDIGFVAKIFVNGDYVYSSQNFFGKEASDTHLANGVFNHIWLYNLISTEAELMVDNIYMGYEDLDYYE